MHSHQHYEVCAKHESDVEMLRALRSDYPASTENSVSAQIEETQ